MAIRLRDITKSILCFLPLHELFRRRRIHDSQKAQRVLNSTRTVPIFARNFCVLHGSCFYYGRRRPDRPFGYQKIKPDVPRRMPSGSDLNNRKAVRDLTSVGGGALQRNVWRGPGGTRQGQGIESSSGRLLLKKCTAFPPLVAVPFSCTFDRSL